MEGVVPETQEHKITNVPVFYMALGLNDFDAVKSVAHKSLHQLYINNWYINSYPVINNEQ